MFEAKFPYKFLDGVTICDILSFLSFLCCPLSITFALGTLFIPVVLSASDWYNWHPGQLLIRPSGFFEFNSLERSVTTADTISTRFGRIPLGNSKAEGLFSIRHSRVFLNAEAPLFGGRLAGFMEDDFMNTAPKHALRFRQLYGEYEKDGWQLLAGQAWSLLRPNRVGIQTEEGMMNTLVPEPNYHVGITGIRDKQVRIRRKINDKWQAAVAFEATHNLTMKVAGDLKYAHLELLGAAGGRDRRGVGFSASIHARKSLNVITHNFWSEGIGPEELALLPAHVHAHATLQGLEWKLPRGWQLFGYGGIVYGTRSTSNRTVRQWSAGFVKRITNSPGKPNVQITGQVSQFDRSLWNNAHGEQTYAMLAVRYSFPSFR